MKPATLKALRGSIAHWKRMATGKQRLGEQPTGECCSLCELFNKDENDLCDGCPVAEKTGALFCKGTPWFSAHSEWRNLGFSPKFSELAAAELAFLQSLLPKKNET